MPFSRFPNRNMWLVKETSDLLQLGWFRVGEATELKYAQLTLLKIGAHGSTERVRLKLYPDSAYTTAIYTSDWVNIADLSGISASNWIGWVRFDFTRKHLATTQTYWMALESENYTRNADTHYMAIKTDWPDTISGQYIAPQIRIVGYR